MKRVMAILGGSFFAVSLWAANIGMVSVYGGYNAWIVGQLLFYNQITNQVTDARMDAGGVLFGGEFLLGRRGKTMFGIEIAYHPLLTFSGTLNGEKKSVGIVQIPVLVKVSSGGEGIYGDMGLGLSFVSSFGSEVLQEVVKLFATDPSLAFKGGFGFRYAFTDIVGLDVGVQSTIVFGDYGLFKGFSEKPPIWWYMLLFWQVNLKAGLNVYF